jgi:hypothetical protein
VVKFVVLNLFEFDAYGIFKFDLSLLVSTLESVISLFDQERPLSKHLSYDFFFSVLCVGRTHVDFFNGFYSII